MKKFIKRFLTKLLGIDNNKVIKDLESRIETLEFKHGRLIDFISEVFPRYYIRFNVVENYNNLVKKLDKESYWDKDISEVIDKKKREVNEELKRSITVNNLDIESTCLKVFTKLINEKFPIPEEFKEEQNQDSEYIGGKL